MKDYTVNNDLAYGHDYISDLELGDAIIPVFSYRFGRRTLECSIKIIDDENGQMIIVIPKKKPDSYMILYASGSTRMFKDYLSVFEPDEDITAEEIIKQLKFEHNYVDPTFTRKIKYIAKNKKAVTVESPEFSSITEKYIPTNKNN